MSPNEEHEYYMLLHDMINIRIMANGFAHIEYFPHFSPEIRLAYGKHANVSEQLFEFEQSESE